LLVLFARPKLEDNPLLVVHYLKGSKTASESGYDFRCKLREELSAREVYGHQHDNEIPNTVD